jgi:PRTRC genetic system protein C
MAITVTPMKRIFQFSSIRLPDPNPAMAVDEVKALYSAQYPDLATAAVNGPQAVGDKLRFERSIGSKG